MADVDEEIKALQKEREAGITAAADGEGDTGGDGVGDADAQNEADRVALTGAGAYDKDIYGGGGDKFAGCGWVFRYCVLDNTARCVIKLFSCFSAVEALWVLRSNFFHF